MELTKEEIKACFKRAKRHLKMASTHWESNKKLMMGQGPTPQVRKENRLAEAYGLFRTLVSQILVQTPEVFFESKTEAGRVIAKIMTDATNYDFEIGKVHQKLVRATWKIFPYGYGLLCEDLENYKAKINVEKEEQEIIEQQNFFWREVPVRDAMFDPDGMEISFEDHRFQFIAYYSSKANIMAMKRSKQYEDGYFNLDSLEGIPSTNYTQINIDKAKYFQQEAMMESDTDLSDDYKQIKLWCMYDRMSEKLYHLTDFLEEHVRTQDWPCPVKIQGVLQFPLHMLALNTDGDTFYPTPEIDLFKTQLVNLMRLNDTYVTDMVTKLRKYAGLSGYITKDQLSKFVDVSQPNSVVILGDEDVIAGNANLPKIDSAGDALFKLQDIEPDPNLPMAMAEQRAQIARITGLTSVAQQGAGPAPRSAREAARQNDMIQRMNQMRLAPLERTVASMAMYHMMLVKEAGSDLAERYYRISDAAPALDIWRKYVPSAIPDEKDIFCDVYTGSSTPKTLDSKREQTLKEMSIMAPILEKNGFSLMPLIYKWAEIFQVRNFDQLVKNQKGAAMEALAAMVMAGKKGGRMNPGVLMNTSKALIDAVLSPAEQQMVLQAMNDAMSGEGPSGGGASEANAPKPAGMNANMNTGV